MLLLVTEKTLPLVLGVVSLLWRPEQLIHSVTSLYMNSSPFKNSADI